MIGGSRGPVDEVVADLKCPFFELPTVSTVHCSIGREVEADLRHSTTSRRSRLRESRSTAESGCQLRRRPRSAGAAIAASGVGNDRLSQVDRTGLRGWSPRFRRGRARQLVLTADRSDSPRPAASGLFGLPGRRRPARWRFWTSWAGSIAERVPVDLTGLYGSRLDPDVPTAADATSTSRNRHTIRIEVRGSGFQRASSSDGCRQAAGGDGNPALPGRSRRAGDRRASARSRATQGRLLEARPAEDSRCCVRSSMPSRPPPARHHTFLKVAHDSADLIAKHACLRARVDRGVETTERRSEFPGQVVEKA